MFKVAEYCVVIKAAEQKDECFVWCVSTLTNLIAILRVPVINKFILFLVISSITMETVRDLWEQIIVKTAQMMLMLVLSKSFSVSPHPHQ